jgi:hypothetical protein
MPSEYNVLSNEQRSALARKKVIDFVNKFNKFSNLQLTMVKLNKK